MSGIPTLEVLQERYRISRTKLLSYRRGVLVGTRFSSKRGRAPTFDDDDENEILRLVLESGKEISSISDEDLRFFAEKVHIEGNLSRERDTRGAQKEGPDHEGGYEPVEYPSG